MRLSRSFDVAAVTKMRGSPGRYSLKTLWACLRSSSRSQRNRMRLAQPARSRSVAERDGDAGLARAGGLNDQRLAVLVLRTARPPA